MHAGSGKTRVEGAEVEGSGMQAAGGLIRHILKQLEAINLVEKGETRKGGRRITPQGQRDLDLIAARIPRKVPITYVAEEAVGLAVPATTSSAAPTSAEDEGW